MKRDGLVRTGWVNRKLHAGDATQTIPKDNCMRGWRDGSVVRGTSYTRIWVQTLPSQDPLSSTWNDLEVPWSLSERSFWFLTLWNLSLSYWATHLVGRVSPGVALGLWALLGNASSNYHKSCPVTPFTELFWKWSHSRCGEEEVVGRETSPHVLGRLWLATPRQVPHYEFVPEFCTICSRRKSRTIAPLHSLLQLQERSQSQNSIKNKSLGPARWL